MPVRLTILGSGSSGNCAYVEADEARILVDAGFSGRQIRKRLAAIGRTPEKLTGILVTHEHSDHVQGLEALARKLHIPVYCNRPTQEAIQYQLGAKLDFRLEPLVLALAAGRRRGFGKLWFPWLYQCRIDWRDCGRDGFSGG